MYNFTKQVLITFISLTFVSSLHAQEASDGIKFAQRQATGTARSQAIGGAMGSLGGDISAAGVNPAGLGFFKTSEFSITPGFNFFTNKTAYPYTSDNLNQKGTYSNDRSLLTIPAAGLVLPLGEAAGTNWRSFTLGINFTPTTNFANKTYLEGDNYRYSMTDKWVQDLRNQTATVNHVLGDYTHELYSDGAKLGVATYLLDIMTLNGNSDWYSSANAANGLLQIDRVTEKGFSYELSAAVAANYGDKWMFGLTVANENLTYKKERAYSEDDISGVNDNEFAFWEYQVKQKTKGDGYNVKLGVIYTPTSSIRIGAAFHTPTWYQMVTTNDNVMITNTENFEVDGSSERSSATRNFYGNNPSELIYKYRTPYKALASVSYIFGTRKFEPKAVGFITADVEYIDYTTTHYRITEQKYNQNVLNAEIKQNYKSAFNTRIGGELKIDWLALRGGFAYNGSPYNFGDADGSTKKISGGVGFRKHGVFLDLTYVHTMSSIPYYSFNIAQPKGTLANYGGVSDIRMGTVAATFGVKF
ncbi:long-subunit fatty acid transport protein [Chitinophaga skermanii]|uniref:Long-subunit fatty acid transport protein n=1 Tax=Chitinophaga skermanii TaxID=331697 RepID=A0A327QMG3_9BACT|nr:hypothetical protein [Chitinophaga skermanii]RAJ05228.1 long-subunit fatty acid transport protein [Chitinophaga skermanii]